MKIYRARKTNSRDQFFWILGYGTIVVLLGILLFSLQEPKGVSDSTRHAIGWLAGAIVLFSVVSAYVLSAKEGRWRVKRASEWELTGEKIIQRQKHGTTIEVPLDQIKSLHDYRGWLIIRGAEPTSQIAVPQEVNDFEELKRELSAYRTVIALKHKISPFTFLPGLALIAAYVLVFASREQTVVVVSGITALALQGAGFYALLGRSRNVHRLKLFLICAFSWLVIAWLVYQRVKTAM